MPRPLLSTTTLNNERTTRKKNMSNRKGQIITAEDCVCSKESHVSVLLAEKNSEDD